MSKIPFINIADTQCWIIYMLPFSEDERREYTLVNDYQQKCIKEKSFGMGWIGDNCSIPFQSAMNEENIDRYKTEYKIFRENENNKKNYNFEDGILTALKHYKEMKKGDYIIMRAKNSHYFIGKLLSNPIYIHQNKEPYNRLSWGSFVEEWVELKTDDELPSELVGRLSQKRHSTVQRIDGYRLRLLTISTYEKYAKKKTEDFSIIPKLKISKYNFVRNMNYKELEDLVSIYISNKHSAEGYILLPSSCKISQQNYEFRYVATNKKPITCQVKNQHNIEIENYMNENAYEKIYFFSGMWSDDDVLKLNFKYSSNPAIYVISPSELYNTLLSTDVFKNPYYLFSNDIVTADKLPLYDYKHCKNFSKKINCKEYTLSNNNDFANFIKKDGLFYSSEFEALILKYHILEDRDIENKYINQILFDINRQINL